MNLIIYQTDEITKERKESKKLLNSHDNPPSMEYITTKQTTKKFRISCLLLVAVLECNPEISSYI